MKVAVLQQFVYVCVQKKVLFKKLGLSDILIVNQYSFRGSLSWLLFNVV